MSDVVHCKACGRPTVNLLAFCQECRDTHKDWEWHKANPPKQQEHAPGHPIYVQAGPPNGKGGYLYSRGCTLADCDWHEVVGR